MKRFAIIGILTLIGFLVNVQSISAQGQSAKRVTVNLRSASVYDFFDAIKKQTGLNFIMKSGESQLKKIDVNEKDKPVKDVIKKVMSQIGCSYDIEDGIVTVFSTQEKKNEPRAISGIVTDTEGAPLPGAVIRIKGTKRGAVTDENGIYLFHVLPTPITLIFSYVGMADQEIKFPDGTKPIRKNVKLKSNTDIDEVVVTGYQVINKRALTSAVSTIKAEDIIRPDAFSLDQMLEGQVPDMMFISKSGESGVAPQLRIRGTSTLIGSREPLWVVDGVVVQDPVPVSPAELNDPDYINRIGNAIAGLNPQDIERLDILKDASATALYGSKAANGVIVIATKRGREGKPQIRYSNNFNYKMRPRYTDRSVDVMNSKERIQFSRELFKDHYQYESTMSPVGYEGLLQDLYAGKIDDATFSKQVGILETMNTDWFDLLTHDSFSQQHTVSLSGGSKNGRYYASVGYTDTDDVVNDTKNNRYSAVLNLDTNLTPWLSASFGMKGNISKRNYYQEEISPIQYAYTASRAIPAYTADGQYYYYDRMTEPLIGYKYNILNELEHSKVDQEGSGITLDANLRFKFNDWLSANTILSYTSQTTDISGYWGEQTWHIANLRRSNFGEELDNATTLAPQGGELNSQYTRQNSWTARIQLDWNKYFGANQKHNFNGGLGFEASSNHYKGYSSIERGYYPDRGLSFVEGIDVTKYPAYAGWVVNNVPILTDDLSNVLSGYLTMTYSYNRMVYVNANARVDGSNRFGDQSNNKLLPVWSVSSSFNFSELPFMKELTWIDYLTLKTSYGFQGNIISSESPVMTIKKDPMNDYYNEFTASAQRNPNPNLKWERTNSYNIGLEASFCNRRIQLEASVYLKRTKNAFMSKTISTVNGYKSYVVNGGNISNDGYSIAATFNPIRTKDWNWTISTSFSRTINAVKNLPAGEEYELENFLNGSAIVKGQPVGTFYSYKFLGLSPVDGGPLFDDWGDHWEDLSGLSKYDTYTRVLTASGSREPYMAGGLNTVTKYKNFRLSATFAYSLGAKTRLFSMFGADYNSAGAYDANDIRPEWNVSRDYLDRWQNPGDEAHTQIPAIIGHGQDAYDHYHQHWSEKMSKDGIQTIANNYWDMYDYSDIRVVSANYLKCNNISLTYEVPRNRLRTLKIARLDIIISASNLFTISDKALKGQTPTQGGFTNIQLSDRPSYSMGINLTI